MLQKWNFETHNLSETVSQQKIIFLENLEGLFGILILPNAEPMRCTMFGQEMMPFSCMKSSLPIWLAVKNSDFKDPY